MKKEMSLREQMNQRERAMNFALMIRVTDDDEIIILKEENLKNAKALSYEFEKLLKEIIAIKTGEGGAGAVVVI